MVPETCSGRAGAVNVLTGRSAHAIFGSPDDVKFRSSMTLFGRADPAEPAFRTALVGYFDGQEDPRTLEKLAGQGESSI